MSDPYLPVEKQTRESNIFVGDGGAVYGPFDFKIFDEADVMVWTLALDQVNFSLQTVTVEKQSDQPFDFFTVTFPAGQPATTKIIVFSAREDSRSAGVRRGTGLDPDALEREFSKLATLMQELRRDLDRAWKSDFDRPGVKLDAGVVDGDTLMLVGNRLTKGANAIDIANAQENAENAAGAAVSAGEARDAALQAAASLHLPLLTPADAGKSLTVAAGGLGYEVGYGGADLFEQMTAYLAGVSLETAEISSAAIVAGTDGNGIYDGFNSLGYVDVAGATALDTSVAGRLKPSATSTSLGNGATPAAGPSGLAGVTIADRSYNLTNNGLVTEIKVYSGAARSFKQKIVRRVSATVYDVVYSQNFEHPGGGWATMVLSTPYKVPSSGSFYVATYYASATFNINTKAATARSAFAGEANGTALSGWTETTGEIPATTATLLTAIGSMIVSSIGFSFSTPPDWVRLAAFVLLGDAVLGTDMLFDFSADAGANWQAVPMAQGYTRPGGSVIILSGLVPVTTVIGSAAKWRCRSLNSKIPALLAAGITLGAN